MAFWLLRLEEWFLTSQPDAIVDMCITCGHYNSSKAACSQCGLRRSWAEVVKRVQQTNSATPPSQPQGRISLGKSVHHWKKGFNTPAKRHTANLRIRDSQVAEEPFLRASKAKQQAAQAAFEKAEADKASGLGRTREAGTFANHPANVHTDDIVQSGTT